MVLADGVIDAGELETLYKIGTEQYGITQEEIASTVRDAGTSFIVPDSLHGKVRLLYNMAHIAYADGEIDSSERELLKKYIAKMAFAEDNIEEIANFLFDSVKDGVTIDEILTSITR